MTLEGVRHNLFRIRGDAWRYYGRTYCLIVCYYSVDDLRFILCVQSSRYPTDSVLALDSTLDKQIQSLRCYRYTTPQ